MCVQRCAHPPWARRLAHRFTTWELKVRWLRVSRVARPARNWRKLCCNLLFRWLAGIGRSFSSNNFSTASSYFNTTQQWEREGNARIDEWIDGRSLVHNMSRLVSFPPGRYIIWRREPFRIPIPCARGRASTSLGRLLPNGLTKISRHAVVCTCMFETRYSMGGWCFKKNRPNSQVGMNTCKIRHSPHEFHARTILLRCYYCAIPEGWTLGAGGVFCEWSTEVMVVTRKFPSRECHTSPH